MQQDRTVHQQLHAHIGADLVRTRAHCIRQVPLLQHQYAAPNLEVQSRQSRTSAKMRHRTICANRKVSCVWRACQMETRHSSKLWQRLSAQLGPTCVATMIRMRNHDSSNLKTTLAVGFRIFLKSTGKKYMTQSRYDRIFIVLPRRTQLLELAQRFNFATAAHVPQIWLSVALDNRLNCADPGRQFPRFHAREQRPPVGFARSQQRRLHHALGLQCNNSAQALGTTCRPRTPCLLQLLVLPRFG